MKLKPFLKDKNLIYMDESSFNTWNRVSRNEIIYKFIFVFFLHVLTVKFVLGAKNLDGFG